ncbi:MAG: hypothetical protein M3R05_05140, partial [Chloroflexota bacterium]|nr:hypothetical protein [Chloroflexota bacterium]
LGVGTKPRITVFNKIDKLDADLRAGPIPSNERAVFVSALSGEGLAELVSRVGDALRAGMVAVDAVVPYERGELVARARTSGDVEEEYQAGGVRVSGHLPHAIAGEVAAAGRRNGRASRLSQP